MDRRKRVPYRDGEDKPRKRRKGEKNNGGWLSSITSYVKKSVPKKVESFLFGEDFEDLSDEEEERKKRVVVFEETPNVTGNFKYPKIAKLSSFQKKEHVSKNARPTPQVRKHDSKEKRRNELKIPKRFYIQRGACTIDIDSLKFKWLRQECVRRDLKATGSKSVLVERLRKFLTEEFVRKNSSDTSSDDLVTGNQVEEEGMQTDTSRPPLLQRQWTHTMEDGTQEIRLHRVASSSDEKILEDENNEQIEYEEKNDDDEMIFENDVVEYEEKVDEEEMSMIQNSDEYNNENDNEKENNVDRFVQNDDRNSQQQQPPQNVSRKRLNIVPVQKKRV